jgi:hypothetical protein
MTTPTTPPVPSGSEDPDAPSRSRLALVATLAAVAVLLGGWVYVLFIYDPGLMIDELADRTFPTQAEQICAVAKEQLAELPPAELAASASERADVVARTNVILTDMVRDLRPLAPTEPPNAAKGVNEWLDDWLAYIGDRERYVDNLRVDDEARFLEQTKGSDTKGISRAINSFAQVNRMDSCTTPADLS